MSFYLKKYMWLISLVAVILCSYFLAKMTANLVSTQFQGTSGPSVILVPETKGEGLGKQVASAESYKDIIERNVFDSTETEALKANDPGLKTDDPKKEEEPVNLTGEAVLTGLSIKLISTFSVGDGTDDRSSSIISSGSKKGGGGEDVYTVNDEKQFAPETKITKILFNRVEFVNKGRLEYVELEDFAKGVSMNVPPQREEKSPEKKSAKKEDEPKIEAAGDGKFVIDRAEVDAAIANLDKLYTQIRAVPHFKSGKPDGLKLLSVKSGSLFSKLGLSRGDILQKINGMELDIKKGLEIFNQLKSENNITIDIERRGKAEALEYEIR